MVTLLRRLFIRDYLDTSRPEVRVKHGMLAAVFGIVSNLLLVGLKMAAAIWLASRNGWVFSMALVGDALNNVSDFASSLVTLLGFIFSKKPADKKHPYGHRRIEYVAGLVVAIFVVVAAAELLIQSVSKAIEGVNVGYDVFALVVMGVSILLKALQGYVNLSLAKTISSTALHATAEDSFLDAIATGVLLVGATLSHFTGWGFLDSYLGMAVALFVGYSGIRMILEEANPLIGAPFSFEKEKEVIDLALSYAGVLGVHDVLAHDYGPGATFLSFHIEVDEAMSLSKAHDLADELERAVSSKWGYQVTIHVDPIALGDDRTERYLAAVKARLAEISPDLSVHDFHLREGKARFDVQVPFELDIDEVKQRLETSLREEDLDCSITYDHPFAQ